MRYNFVINPAAGKGAPMEGLAERIKEVCDSLCVEYEIYFTTCVGDATQYVRRVSEAYPNDEMVFYACGGDGTLCEVANGIMSVENRDRLRLGTVPSGTGNDFVRNFSRTELFGDISAQINGAAMDIDLIGCNDMYAVNMINIGFDCEVVCKKQELQKHRIFPQKLAYVVGLVITLVRKPGLKCKISYDGGAYEEKDLLLTTYGNGEYCGGGFHSNPESSLCNGKINALAVNNVTRRKFISIVGSYKKGTHLVHTDILKSQLVDKVDMIFNGTTNISVDGEVVCVDGLKLRAVRNAVKFIVPKGSEYIKRKIKSVDTMAPVGV